MPKCSIILTSYNRPDYLKEAIESILRQTLTDWQLIIVDSSDNPGVHAIFHELRRNSKVLCIYEPRGVKRVGKISQAWNRALDFVEGEYVALLDDDNRKMPQFCEEMSQYLDVHKEYEGVACFSRFINEEGQPNPNTNRSPMGVSKQSIIEINQIDSGELMLRSSAFDKIGYFDERLPTLEDWDIIIRFFYETSGIGILEKELTEYRIHGQQRINRTLNINEASLLVIKKKQYGQKLRISCIIPDDNRLTTSQKQVCEGIQNTLSTIPFVQIQEIATISKYNIDRVKKSQFILLPSILNIKIEEMEKLGSLKIPLVTLHMEDTQGFWQTIKRDRYADWIVANDIVTFNKLVRGIKNEGKI